MKRIVSLLIVTLFFGSAKAQDYYHGLGGQINYGIFSVAYDSPDVNYSGTNVAAVPGIVYKGSLGFEISRSVNFAVSAYPFLGLSLNVNSQTGGTGSFGAELPVLGEIYFGDIDDGCFFLGAGLSFGYLASSYGFGVSSGAIIGPQLGMGGQFYFRDRLIGLRLAYTHGLNATRSSDPDIVFTKDRKSVISLGFYYPFGQ